MKNELTPLLLPTSKASNRWGYSEYWFARARWAGNGPPYLKLNNGRVFYPVEETDQWFLEHGLINSTSEQSKEGETR